MKNLPVKLTCEDGSHTRGGMTERGQVENHLAIYTNKKIFL